jgi:hypothetical protein
MVGTWQSVCGVDPVQGCASSIDSAQSSVDDVAESIDSASAFDDRRLYPTDVSADPSDSAVHSDESRRIRLILRLAHWTTERRGSISNRDRLIRDDIQSAIWRNRLTIYVLL